MIALICSFYDFTSGAAPQDVDKNANSSPHQATEASLAVIDALEKSVLESRQQVRAGKLELDSRYTTNKTQPIYETFTTHYTVYYEGTKIRMDRERLFTDHRVLERRILNDKQFIRADAASPVHGLPAIEVNAASTRLAAQSDLFPPGLLGLRAAPITQLGHTGLFDPFERADTTNSSVSDAVVEGHPAKLIEFQAGKNHATNVKIWMSRDQRSGVLGIRLESTVGSPPRPHVWEAINEPRLWPPVDLWYPARVTYRFYDAGLLIEEEIATIDELIYDRAPTEGVFTVGALQPEQGREVSIDGTQLMVWNDGKLAPLRRPSLEPGEAASRGRQRFNLLLLLNGIFLLAVAVFIIVWIRRGGKAS
jgi:hypothetical protein